MLPSVFICHGAPTLVLEDNRYTRFLSRLAHEWERPQGIVVFTAHWESPVISITHTDQPYETIHDFYGFPREMYHIRYPAKGSTGLSQRIQQLLANEGLHAELDAHRGLDHGVWVPLRLLYPQADIPVVAISVNPARPPAEQYRIGRALAPLRREDILILGSGATVHNLRALEWDRRLPEDVVPWAASFDDWLIRHVTAWDRETLFDYAQQAPYAKLAVPTAEHLMPLFLAMGAADDKREARLLHRSYDYGTLSMIALQFGGNSVHKESPILGA